MMKMITEWVTNIILIILFATILDLLLPNTSFQKYIKMVVGLLLILAILNPILKFAGSDINQVFSAMGIHSEANEEEMKNSIDLKKKDIQASQGAYVLNITEEQMKKQITGEMMKKYGLAVKKVELIAKDGSAVGNQLDPKQLKEVNVFVAKGDSKKDIAVSNVEDVQIDTSLPAKNEKQKEATNLGPAQDDLAKKWQIEKEKIHFYLEGGEGSSQ
ncbi:stage III sporulation protein AF [Fictibacillus sp. Mic-4]|uniref:stage III sporulation protein AF n=1 Tax=Fictibacillus TaxID=1329200 RepID=UPI00042A2661|nr:stage III sporulation protein AF [Fictibacillus gelatini]